ncbi:MAG: hypothetical protein ACRDS0_39630 [Pseudonocardiaceae bacterium]
MPPEYIIGYVMLAAIVALGAGFIFTALSARKGPDDYEPTYHAGSGLTNSLYFKFSTLGTYTIRCLELCGPYHTAMVSSLTVTPSGG